MITHENTLSERESYILRSLASTPDPATAGRARALLDWSRGQSREQIAQETGIRSTQVGHLLRNFAQKRLEVFSRASVERASRGLEGPTTVDALIEQHEVRLGHARYVQSLAIQLFEQTEPVHALAEGWRRLLGIGALLHNLGAAHHEDQHHRVGRDIVLSHEIEGLDPRERDIVACLILFHTKKVKAAKDSIFTELDPESQNATLALSAILRVADGLDFSQTQSTSIVSVQLNGLVETTVEGPHAQTDAARANKRADLWREVLSPPLSVRLADGSIPSKASSKRPKNGVGIRTHDPITQAGRKIVAIQFARIRVLEDAVRKGDDADAIHDMRVATRRMRSAFRLLARYYSGKNAKKAQALTRELAGLLGTVRDLDVMLDGLRSFAATLPLERQRSLDPLISDWQARRARAQKDLVHFLDAQDYREWVKRVERFIESKNESDAARVGDVIPWMLWKRYTKVREFEPRAQQAGLATLHRLRIQCKRLRYAIEFFAETLGPESQTLLDPLIALQDYLGELHDADVASQLVTEFVAGRAELAQQQGIAGASLEGVMSYLAALQARITSYQSGFPERWQNVLRPNYRQALADQIAAL
ncbi:MAG: CHAD domain-containing protein [Rudaea sp.]